MTATSRRAVLSAIGGAFLGVIAYSRRPHWPGFFGGVLRATPVEPLIDPEDHGEKLPPPEYVTSHDDETLAGLEPLQAAFRRREPVELSRREYGRVFSALEELPRFVPRRHEDNYHPVLLSGIYVGDSEYTYRMQLEPWCSDAWWMEVRGTPTRGGLGCRER